MQSLQTKVKNLMQTVENPNFFVVPQLGHVIFCGRLANFFTANSGVDIFRVYLFMLLSQRTKEGGEIENRELSRFLVVVHACWISSTAKRWTTDVVPGVQKLEEEEKR